MAAATITEVRARILALAALYPGGGLTPTLGTDISTGDPILALPAYTCVAQDAVWQSRGTHRWVATRNYELWVYVATINNVTDESSIRTAIDACDPWIVGLIHYFHGLPQLELAGAASDVYLAMDVDDLRDSGPAQTPLRTKIYSAFRIILPVITAAN